MKFLNSKWLWGALILLMVIGAIAVDHSENSQKSQLSEEFEAWIAMRHFAERFLSAEAFTYFPDLQPSEELDIKHGQFAFVEEYGQWRISFPAPRSMATIWVERLEDGRWYLNHVKQGAEIIVTFGASDTVFEEWRALTFN